MHKESQFAERVANKTSDDARALKEAKNGMEHDVTQELSACSAHTQEALHRHENLKEDVDAFMNDGLQRVTPTGEAI